MIVKMLAAMAVALAFGVVPAANAQQKLAATSQEDQLREKCLRWFDNKKYVGVIKNSNHPQYRARRKVTLTTAVETDRRAEAGKPLCIVKVRSEDDGHQVIFRDYVFDGSIAKWTSPYSNPDHVWLKLTPRGACLQYQGTLSLWGTVYSAGEALFCP